MLHFALAALFAVLPPHPSFQASPAPAAGAQSEEFLKELRGRLKTHPYFSKVVLVEAPGTATLALFLQQPQVPSEGWSSRLAAAELPWFVQAEKRFGELFARPTGIERRPDVPVSVVCCLQTAGDYANYAEKLTLTSINAPAAHFDRKQRWTVTYESGGKLSPGRRRSLQVAEFLRSLVHAHYSGTDGEPEQDFFVMGLAGYMTEDLGSGPSSVGACMPPSHATRAVVDVLCDPTAAFTYLFQLEELCDNPTWPRYFGYADRRADVVGGSVNERMALEAFHGQAVLWTHFLMDAKEQRYRTRYLEYLKQLLTGKGLTSTLRGAFSGVNFDELGREFLTWVVAADAVHRKPPAMPPGSIESLFGGPPLVKAPAGVTSAPAETPAERPAKLPTSPPAPAATARPAFDTGLLRVAADDVRARHGMALVRAASGHLGEAVQRLSDLVSTATDESEKARLERDHARLVALAATRLAILEERRSSGKKLQFSLLDRKLSVGVRGLEGDWILLAENRQGIERLPLSDFSLELLSKELPSPAPTAWMKPYLLWLSGDPRAPKAPLEGAALADYRADAPELAQRLQLGRTGAELEALADRGLPTEVNMAKDACDALEQMLTVHRGSPLLEARREALIGYARAIYALAFEPSRIAELWGGTIEPLGEGKVRWTLDFEDPAQAATFTLRPNGWKDLRGRLSVGAQPIAPKFAVNAGRLEVRGSGVWLSEASFLSISSARYGGRHTWQDSDDGFPDFYLLLGFRDPLSYVALTTQPNLVIFDAQAKVFERKSRDSEIYPDTSYEAWLEHDATGWVASSQGYSARAPDVVSGAGRVGIFAHYAGEFRLDQLSVTGQPDLGQAAARWAEQKCSRLGL